MAAGPNAKTGELYAGPLMSKQGKPIERYKGDWFGPIGAPSGEAIYRIYDQPPQEGQ